MSDDVHRPEERPPHASFPAGADASLARPLDLDDLERRCRDAIAARRFGEVRSALAHADVPDVADLIVRMGPQDEAVTFRVLPRERSVAVFEHLPAPAQERLLRSLGDETAAAVLDDMSPDDRTEFLSDLPGAVTKSLVNLLSPEERHVATRLLGYPEESIGRLMTPEYVQVKPDWTVSEALAHVRVYGRDSETLNVVYVTSEGGRLVDDLRMRELLLTDPAAPIASLMDHRYVALLDHADQETAVAEFRKHDRTALPVVDRDGILVGIVTVDDVLDVAASEATEDIHRIGGSGSFAQRYLDIRVGTMVAKRAPWLVALFFGQLLTASAMGRFTDALADTLALALFVPLIVSSGGNAGSQAATLIIRALTTGEASLRDFWSVVRREVASAVTIGAMLAVLGFARVALGEAWGHAYGADWWRLGVAIAASLALVVVWGSLVGTALPMFLERLGIDPAASSTPFVATLVDVTGIVLYFTVASWTLRI